MMLSAQPSRTPAPVSWAVTWEETDCPLCGGTRHRPVIEAPDPLPTGDGLWFAVVRCESCGLCFTNPRPDAESMSRFYPEQYAPFRRSSDRPRSRWSLGALFHSRPCIERRELPWHGRGRLLDFGCGGGTFLHRMARQGWHVEGLDISAVAVERVRRELQVPVHLGSLPHAELRPQSFDVVTMWHALEHVHDPKTVLRHARELLTRDGLLFVAVPNIDSWAFEMFGPSWYGLDLPRHLTHFTPDTLTRMLQSAGFRARSLRKIRHRDWLRSSARIACRRPETPWWHRLLTIKSMAKGASMLCHLAGRSDSLLAVAEVA